MSNLRGKPQKALAGVKVVEWAQFVSGPYCTKLLADLGAEVIKVEKPGVGDEARRRGPFPNDNPHPERSGLFLYLNTNKLGISLNVESTMGQRIFKELVKQADILVEDNPPRLAKELGLDYETLSEVNPKLIMTSITPFGHTGPYRDFKAHYLNTYHAGGLGYLTPNDLFDSPRQPLKAGGFLGEYGCGLMSAVGTLGALYIQRTTGLGQHVDVAKQEVILTLCMAQVARYPNEGVIQTRLERQRGYGDIFPCKDGHIVEMTNEEYQWQALVELMGNPEWARDERCKLPAFRESHCQQMAQSITEWMMNHSKEEIYHRGQALGCAITPVMTAEDIVNSEQSQARGFFVEIDHPEAGRIKYPAAPYRFSSTPWTVEQPAPCLGQHNEEIYCKRLGVSVQELGELRTAGII